MRVRLGLAYLLVVFSIAAVVAQRVEDSLQNAGLQRAGALARPVPMYVAARRLPAGHRIVTGDMERPDVPRNLLRVMSSESELLGRYLTAGIASGEPIPEALLVTRPIVSTPPEHVIVAIPADRSSPLLRRVGPESRVRLVLEDGDDPDDLSDVSAPYSVLAVDCPPEEDAECDVLLAVPEGEAPTLVSRLTDELELRPVAAARGG